MNQKVIDENGVAGFSAAMREKLAAARENGREGWQDPEMVSDLQLASDLVNHLCKDNDISNFVDIANYCMFLHQRGAYPGIIREALITLLLGGQE